MTGASFGQIIDEFHACFGRSPSTLQCINPIASDALASFDADPARTFCANEIGKLDPPSIRRASCQPTCTAASPRSSATTSPTGARATGICPERARPPLRHQPRDRIEVLAEDVVRRRAHPAVEHGGVDGAEVRREPQVAAVEVGERDGLAVHAAVDASAEQEHRRGRAAIGAPLAFSARRPNSDQVIVSTSLSLPYDARSA